MGEEIERSTNENVSEQIGTCRYCGQTKAIQALVGLSQSDLDNMVTDQCMCPDAKTERRKKERKAKISAFVKKHFTPERANFIQTAISLVEGNDFDKISCNYDSKTCTIWVDADSCLHLKVQKREDDELKV